MLKDDIKAIYESNETKQELIKERERRSTINYRMIRWACLASLALSLTLIVIAAFYHNGTGKAEPYLIIGFLMLILISISTCLITLLALHRFYQIANSVNTSKFEVNYKPIISQSIALILWVIAVLIESIYEIIYYSNLYDFDNVTKLIIIDDFTLAINLFSFTVLAYLLNKMGGIIS